MTVSRTTTAAILLAVSLVQSHPTFAQDTQLIEYVKRSFACERAGDKNGAEANFTKALAIEKYPLVAYIDRAILRFESGDHKGGFEDINQAVKICSIDSKALSVRAHFRAQTGDVEGALKDYAECLRWDSKDSMIYTGRGILYLTMENPQSASKDFDKALVIDPTNLLARFQRMCLTENETLAREDFQKIVSAKPKDAQDHVVTGNTFVHFDDIEKGANEFTQAILLKPDYAHAYYNRAVTKEQRGDKPGALRDYDKAVESDSSCAQAYFNRGILKLSLNDYAGGMSDLKRAIELDPSLEKRARDKPFKVMTS